MWVEDLHPRDEFGRFRLKGVGGHWDRMLGAEANRAHLRNIAEYNANQARQSVLEERLRAGTLTDAEDAEWDRLGERATHLARNVIPKAHWKGAEPHDDGFWRFPRTDRFRGYWDRVLDAEGRPVPLMAQRGGIRVGERPDGKEGGVWHMPGEYAPGRVPILRNDFGARMSQLEPEPSPSRRHRERQGAFARGEIKAAARQQGPGDDGWKEVRRRGKELRIASPEIHGAYQNDPRNPVGRMRTARKKRQRVNTTTWIQRLNAQFEANMEGR